MSVTPITVPGFPPPPPGFSHATTATGTKTIHISGQVGTDASNELVSDDLAGQAAQAFINVKAAVEAAGATLADVAHSRVYVVDWDPSKVEALYEGVAKAAEAGVHISQSSATLIGVQSLFTPGMLIEVEVVAITA